MPGLGSSRGGATEARPHIRESVMLQRWLSLFGLPLALALLAPAADAQMVSQIRLMLHPYAAAPGDLPADVLAKLETLAGMPLAISGATRTGALEFSLPQAISEADAGTMLRRLRDDRSVLWAEPIRPGLSLRLSAIASPIPGNKLMVRLVGDPDPDWNTLLPR